MGLSSLVRGLPGHPIHPPLSDATIGIYTFATIAAVLSVLGVSEENTATAWWLGLIVGLVTSGATAASGLADWLTLTRGTPLWRTATSHMIAMLSATAMFLLTAVVGHGSYVDDEVGAGSLILTLIAFALLTLGGWLGGTIVFVHGMRVLNLVDEPSARASSPVPSAEEERAERI